MIFHDRKEFLKWKKIFSLVSKVLSFRTKHLRSCSYLFYISSLISISRSSLPELFRQKGVLKHFRRIHEKTPVPESPLLKNRLCYRCFPVNFAKLLSTPFLQNISGGCFCFSKRFGSIYLVRYFARPVKVGTIKSNKTKYRNKRSSRKAVLLVMFRS